MKYHKDPLAESRKEGSVYGRIPYKPGSLMILQAVKRIVNIRFNSGSDESAQKNTSHLHPDMVKWTAAKKQVVRKKGTK